MTLQYTPRAIADLAEIGEYLKSRSPPGAKRVQAAILGTLQMVVRFPHVGRLQTLATVRKIGLRSYPYLIYYSVELDEIVVLSIQHGARMQDYEDA